MSKYGKTIPYSDDYHSVHVWLNRKYRKPARCVCCGEQCGRIEWAIKPGCGTPHRTGDHFLRASRNIEDYVALGASCHRKLDFGVNEVTVGPRSS